MTDTYRHKGLRKKLVSEVAAMGVTDRKVLDAMNKVPRHYFMSTAFLEFAYENKAFQIGAGQTISLPTGSYTVSSTDVLTCQQTGSATINEPPQIVIQETHTDVSCFGGSNGSITLTVTGGTGTNYLYNWVAPVSTTNSASSLTAANYNITVTDENLCTALKTVTIISPTQLVLTLTPADPLCFTYWTATC